MATYINSLPNGRIVLVGIRDDGTVNMTENAYQALVSLGSSLCRDVEFRDSWAMIGVKGAPQGSVPEVHVAKGHRHADIQSEFPRLYQTEGYRFVYQDHIGSTRQLSRSDMQRDYYPFGQTLNAAGDDLTSMQFSQKQVAPDSTIYYFGVRYYSPRIGRWLVPDPAGQGFSPYVYCGNNPLMFVDPDGAFFIPLVAAAGALWGGYQGYQAGGWQDAISGAFQGAVSNGGMAVATGGLGISAKGPFGSHFSAHTVMGGAIGGISNVINEKSFWEGFGIGAAAGAVTWSGGMIASKEFFGAGLLGNLVGSGGISILENLYQGNRWNYSYTTYFGPASLTLTKNQKAKLGLSSFQSLWGIAENIYHGNSLDLMNSLSSGTLVFESGPKGGENGYAIGNIITLQDRNARSVHKNGVINYTLGHERIHALQNRMFRLFSGIGNSNYKLGSDLDSIVYSGFHYSYGYLDNPFEQMAFYFGF